MEKTTVSVKVSKTELGKIKDSSLIIGFFKENLKLSRELKNFDDANGNILSSYIKDSQYKAEKGEIKSVYINKNIKNVVLVGLGEEKKYTAEILSAVVADASKRLRDNGSGSFSINLKSFTGGLNEENAVEKTALSILIGLYRFTEYKTKDRDNIKYIDGATIITDSSKNFDRQLGYASAVGMAVNKTRDFVNTPPNIATPEYIADYARETARKAGLKCEVFDEKQIEKMGMGCFFAVGRGSVNKPKLVVIRYSGASGKPVAIVGKGVTFDSGGLNLKPYPYILNMKDDMAGAISAIHIAEACSKLKLPVNLVVVAPLCENMIDANSYRPDDVLTAYNKMTVEIKNTDAEGRLILADALAYAAEIKPQCIIDLATLTGASMVVLGYVATPFLSTDEKLSHKIKEASKKSMEKVWELPLWPEYDESIKSDVADIKNISEEGDAGVIIGAAFLKNFVGDTPWAHIDIGTTVWSKADKGVLTKGATGAIVRLMMEMLREWR